MFGVNIFFLKCCKYIRPSPGGLYLSQRDLNWESQSWQKKTRSWQSRNSWCFQKASLDNQDISVEIEISQFCLDGHMQIQYFSVEVETYWDLSRLLWLLVIFVDFSIFSRSRPWNNEFLQISRLVNLNV
jgi:hypothetical protein